MITTRARHAGVAMATRMAMRMERGVENNMRFMMQHEWGVVKQHDIPW